MGTTWELLPAEKYLKTGNTPLQQGGSNSFTITKENLPAVKVQLESFSVTTQPHKHRVPASSGWSNESGGWSSHDVTKADNQKNLYTLESGGENTGTASPYTQNLGSGTPISINPTYITIRAWKRLT